MKYVVLMQVDPAVIEALTDAEREALMAGHGQFIEEGTASGEVLGTSALGDPSQSAVIRSEHGTPRVTDGPFAETKEFMGGYYLLDVESRERAIELALRIPDARIDGLALEVRPVMFSAGGETGAP